MEKCMPYKTPQKEQLVKPTFEALLKLGGSGTNNEITETVIRLLELTNEQVDEPQNGHPSMTKLEYELAWARTYLKKAGVINRAGYCLWEITPHYMKGKAIDLATIIKAGKNVPAPSVALPIDNIEMNEDTFNEADEKWREEISNIIKKMDPYGFERLSMRLLRECGFDEVSVTKKSGDGGIDGFGILKINDLFSLHIAFQCKRYGEKKISADDIRQFRGTLPANIERGIFITTGGYTQAAVDEAKRPDAKNIDLINGEQFIDKLAEYEIGCKKITTYIINRDFFDSI
jgi:restriction system protein